MICYHMGSNCKCRDQDWDPCMSQASALATDLFFLAYLLSESHFLFCLVAAW